MKSNTPDCGFMLAFFLSSLVGTSTVAAQDNLPTFDELAVTRGQAHQDRFKTFVLKKLEVHSSVQNQRGMCLDFIGDSDGLHRSILGGGPLLVDLADCGKEGSLIDGRIRALQILGPREHREGLSVEQIDKVVDEINALFAEKRYTPSVKE